MGYNYMSVTRLIFKTQTFYLFGFQFSFKLLTILKTKSIPISKFNDLKFNQQIFNKEILKVTRKKKIADIKSITAREDFQVSPLEVTTGWTAILQQRIASSTQAHLRGPSIETSESDSDLSKQQRWPVERRAETEVPYWKWPQGICQQ